MIAWIGIGLSLAAVTGFVWLEGGAASALRHLYLLPVLWASVRFGTLGGGLAGLLAVLLYAPVALPAIEGKGLTAGTTEGIVSLALFLFVGSVTGSWAHRARTRVERYRLLLALQRMLGSAGELRTSLGEVVRQVKGALGARGMAIVLAGRAADPIVVADGEDGDHVPMLATDSAAGWVLRTGQRLFVRDLASDERFGPPEPGAPRPRRALLVPLGARGRPMGVLVVERRGEFPRELRATVDTLALQLGLAIDNARLVARRRRFAQELEDKVAAATWRLTELDRAKSEFVSVVSHELRTPVTAIQGFSELLLSRPVAAATTRRFVEAIHREAERLGRIVADLLDLSRIERGDERALHRAPLALRPLIERNVEIFRMQSGLHTFHCDLPEKLPLVLADPDALDRVLKNLLSNAVKYSPRGGPVRLWARCSADEGQRVELGVEDHGVGISRAALSRIFEKYARVAQLDTRHVRGLGLGLALVRALVEAQNGWVRVESEVGRGSQFTVSLPMAAAAGESQSA